MIEASRCNRDSGLLPEGTRTWARLLLHLRPARWLAGKTDSDGFNSHIQVCFSSIGRAVLGNDPQHEHRLDSPGPRSRPSQQI